MKCPVCKTVFLNEKTNDTGLKICFCKECGGNWVRHEDYYNWKNKKENQGLFDIKTSCFSDESNENESADYMPEYDSKKANLCPDCGRILIKYKVSNDVPFFVDHCGNCNGVWLDKNEWAVLVKNQLHYKISDFFTAPWQKKIREDMTKNRLEEQYIKKFGFENYKKLKDFRDWIGSSNLKSEIIAFLTDDEPYKI